VPAVLRALLRATSASTVCRVVKCIRSEQTLLSTETDLLIYEIIECSIQCDTCIAHEFISTISEVAELTELDLLVLIMMYNRLDDREVCLRCPED
jgi:transcriptional regulator of NAD metabolism